ncbi:MAG: sulfatase [Halioglobus sp.]|nr:sulfatase [Halioglobus sp.]
MKILAFLWARVLDVLGTLVLLTVLSGLFLLYRWVTFGQSDDAAHLQAKEDYLARIAAAGTPVAAPPNIVFILYDDLGYGDFGYGARGVDMVGDQGGAMGARGDLLATPNIDRLAADGVVLSDFHAPAPVCTPSRAGYLTGRLAPRAGLPNVVFPTGSVEALIFNVLLDPDSNVRLPAEEITFAEILQAAGYSTAMVGKWHLGDRSPSLPNDMGFDSYFGALYSNDMEPFALYADREIAVPAPADQRYLTERYTRAATDFIAAQQAEQGPFLLYIAHTFPHDPLHVRPERRGRSRAGLYGDVVEELDDSVGAVVAALRGAGQLDNTLIIITSDNGPWFLGDAGDQRGRKGNTFEGGMRVPFIAHWPAAIPSGRTEHAMAMGTDLLPTFLDILELPPPPDRILDGRSILDVLSQGGATPHDYLYYYDGDTLFAARDERFKYRGAAGVFYATDQMPIGVSMPQKEWLFDLAGDARESYDTSARNPDDLLRLRAAFEGKLRDMEANTRGWR